MPGSTVKRSRWGWRRRRVSGGGAVRERAGRTGQSALAALHLPPAMPSRPRRPVARAATRNGAAGRRHSSCCTASGNDDRARVPRDDVLEVLRTRDRAMNILVMRPQSQPARHTRAEVYGSVTLDGINRWLADYAAEHGRRCTFKATEGALIGRSTGATGQTASSSIWRVYHQHRPARRDRGDCPALD